MTSGKTVDNITERMVGFQIMRKNVMGCLRAAVNTAVITASI
jgi:hypothetical protein